MSDTIELFREDAYLKTCDATVTEVTVTDAGAAVCVDRTVFYPEGGGQPGDTGVITRADGAQLTVTDTRKDRATGAHLHVLEVDSAPPAIGEKQPARAAGQGAHRGRVAARYRRRPSDDAALD